MRKVWLAGAILLLIVLVVLFIRWRKKPAETTSGSPTPIAATVTRKHIDPPPAISLQINHANELTLYRGTPMVLTVSIVNHRAMIADAQEKSDLVYVQQLRAGADRGKVPKENVEAQIARMEPTPEVSAINLGADTAPWDSFLQLSQKLPDGTLHPLNWTTKLVRPSGAKRITLTARTEAELTFTVDPSSATQIPPGEYAIVAALNVPSTSSVPPGTWTGQAESDPMKLIIQDKPARLNLGDEEKLDLHFADYFYASGDFAEAGKRAQAALTVNPESIAAAIALGESQKARGNLKDALEIFQKATAEYYSKYPKSYEPPTLLISRISDIEAKMAGTQPPAAQQP